MNASIPRTLIIGGALLLGATGVALTSLTACESLSQTSPLPSGDASDLDAGQPPPEPEEAGPSSSSGSVDSGPIPASGRVRVANLLEGSPSLDLCLKVDAPGPFEGGWITGSAPTFSGVSKDDGLAFGQVSQHVFVAAAPGAAGTKYLFRVVPLGTPCEGAGSAPIATTASTILRQAGGLTIFVYGVIRDGVDAGDANPKINVVSDTVAPPGNASLFRVVHAVPDIAAFDVVINGDTVLSGIRYGTAYGGPPYATVSATATPPPGFASIAAGVPEDATLTLRSGTTVRSFTVPARLRRGIASTVFAGGSRDKLSVQLCSDRTPPSEENTATCTKLVAQE